MYAHSAPRVNPNGHGECVACGRTLPLGQLAPERVGEHIALVCRTGFGHRRAAVSEARLEELARCVGRAVVLVVDPLAEAGERWRVRLGESLGRGATPVEAIADCVSAQWHATRPVR